MGDRGRLVIPAEVRDRVGLGEGTPVVLFETAAGLVLLTRAQLRVSYADFRISDFRWTAGLCALSGCFTWWRACRWRVRAHNPGGRGHGANDSSQLIKELSTVQSGRTSGVSGS